MKFVSPTLVVALIWGLLSIVLVILPPYLFGTSSVASYFFPNYGSGPSPIFPIGWFAVVASFVFTFVLADVGRAVKALVLSETIAFVASLFILTRFSSPAVFSSPGEITGFFGLLAIFFFLAGMTGSVFGSLLGAWVKEEPGEYTVKFGRHSVISIGLIMILAASFSVFGVGSYVAANPYGNTLKGPMLVANQTLSWNAGTQMVWANFTGSYSRGEFAVTWSSNTNVSFHYLVYPGYNIEELIGRPSSCGAKCLGLVYIWMDGAYGRETAWFQVDNCPVSGCPSGSVQYVIAYWYY